MLDRSKLTVPPPPVTRLGRVKVPTLPALAVRRGPAAPGPKGQGAAGDRAHAGQDAARETQAAIGRQVAAVGDVSVPVLAVIRPPTLPEPVQ